MHFQWWHQCCIYSFRFSCYFGYSSLLSTSSCSQKTAPGYVGMNIFFYGLSYSFRCLWISVAVDRKHRSLTKNNKINPTLCCINWYKKGCPVGTPHLLCPFLCTAAPTRCWHKNMWQPHLILTWRLRLLLFLARKVAHPQLSHTPPQCCWQPRLMWPPLQTGELQ